MSAGNRLDDEGCAADAVARRENSGARGGKSIRIDGNGLAFGESDARVGRDECQTCTLSDRENNRIARDDVIRAGDFLYAQSPHFIETERTDLHALHAAGVSVFIAEDLLEGAVVINRDAFGERGFDLPGVRGHLLTAFETCHRDVAAQTDSGAGDINRDIAAAEDEDVFA